MDWICFLHFAHSHLNNNPILPLHTGTHRHHTPSSTPLAVTAPALFACTHRQQPSVQEGGRGPER